MNIYNMQLMVSDNKGLLFRWYEDISLKWLKPKLMFHSNSSGFILGVLWIYFGIKWKQEKVIIIGLTFLFFEIGVIYDETKKI